jgi:hypothetical protein
MLAVNDHVTVRVPQLRGNLSEVKMGQVVSVAGDKVMVQHAEEFKPKEYSVNQVQSASKTLGLGCNVDNPWEKPVANLIRR